MTLAVDDRDLTSLAGRSVVLTGATGGIGKVVARRIGDAGAAVTLAVRDQVRGRELAAQIPGAEVRHLDLGDLSSVRRFADEWRGPIDVLINNAGLMMIPQATTVDGFEKQLGTNHLGHFALTNLLAPHLTGRVVTVVSKAHMFGRVSFDDPHWRRRRYSPMGAYAQSKLAGLLFTQELQRRFSATGSRLAVAADPGFAATGIARHTERPLLDGLLAVGTRVAAQTPEDGARPVIAAAVASVAPAAWIGPGGLFGMRGSPALVSWPRSASDVNVARSLWELSAAETGVDYTTVESARRQG
ncbi:SDR family NAD(P)-dependent oxidoreductase [Naumannella halotolerans]|uniref:Short-subunit dehydrogenase n=1 Tax=Naumannella halotolerans TaxID=993414 RepID=A0A4R7IZI1_9ACTN|nr:SDR family NAD(P)-dependent oxidoreductase [Naumannella halotolerans]TDT30105.1 short-subunit dehydrogenase [Naumannella halotolerans]